MNCKIPLELGWEVPDWLVHINEKNYKNFL